MDQLEHTLLNSNGNVPLHRRFRALFSLKGLANEDSIIIISKAFSDPSALLKHELAYCLGQIKNPAALPILERVLADLNEDPMVRHEAAEAIGAISRFSSLPTLQKYLDDPERSVRETCQIAIDKIKWDSSNDNQSIPKSSYTSIDPAPPSTLPQESILSLRNSLLDTSLPLFQRYRAMFALRNIGSPEAVDALAAGFADDSALFKHEIAFVFGQLLSTHSVPSLIKVLQSPSQSDMVRHEAAEALGGIATPDVLPHLKEWMVRDDSPIVVRESCQVAIDMWEHENSNNFQYADVPLSTTSVS